MHKGHLLRLLICILCMGAFLYAYIRKQNTITQLRLAIPPVERALVEAAQEKVHLQFEIEQFENPLHLMELARQPEYSHLRFPLLHEVLVLEEKKDP